MNSSLARIVTPWSYRRAQEEAARVEALKARDGECCRRCRRPIRFALTDGHDQGPKVEPIGPQPVDRPPDLGAHVHSHRRCNGVGADHTNEVQERRRRSNEAELFAKSARSPGAKQAHANPLLTCGE